MRNINRDKDEPLRVVVVHWGRTGAGPRFTRAVAAALSRIDDLEIHLSYSLQADSLAQYAALALPGVPVRTFTSARDMVFGSARFLGAARNLRKYIKEERIDVVLSPMLSLWQSLALPFYLPKSTMYLASIHDGVPHKGERSRVLEFCTWLEIRRADVVVAYSEAVAEQLSPRIRPSQRLETTVHGVFAPESDKLDSGRKERRPPWRIGMFGRLNPYKGIDIYAESIRFLRNRGLEVEGSVFGEGGTHVRELAQSYPEIDWNIGWVGEDDVNRVVASFDVLALPYRDASQSGVLAVAMAEGVPVVATPVGGLAEQVTSSGIGVLSEDINSESFSAALLRVIEEPGLYDELSFRGRAAAESSYSWDRIALDMRGMIERAMG